eukprot:3070100-Prymnesium_polylepis.1
MGSNHLHPTMSADEYFDRNRDQLEAAVAAALEETLAAQPENPVGYCAIRLALKGFGVSPASEGTADPLVTLTAELDEFRQTTRNTKSELHNLRAQVVQLSEDLQEVRSSGGDELRQNPIGGIAV